MSANPGISDSLFMKTIRHETVSRPPIWMMRQAGRYMHEYQAIRQSSSFLEMIKTPELAAEITLQPIKAFGFDAAILFSDILTICEALGFSYKLVEKKGPIFSRTIQTAADIESISLDNAMESLTYVFDAIAHILPKLSPYNIPLLGFSGAPFTLASYMIEGKSSPNLLACKTFYYKEPEAFTKLLEKITETVILYVKKQIDAGVSAIQIFDTWACHLNNEEFEKLSLKYVKKIVKAIQDYGSTAIVFCKGSGHTYPQIIKAEPNIISIDSSVKLSTIIDNIPKHMGIQGNLDPISLFGPQAYIKKEVDDILRAMRKRNGCIFNLGHGILPKTPRENVKFVVDLVKGA